MSKFLIIKRGNEYSYKQKNVDERIWFLSDKQIEEVKKFVVEQFYK